MFCRIPKKAQRKTFRTCKCGCGERIVTAYQSNKQFKQGHYMKWLSQQKFNLENK